jgi:hypothetical protein
MRARIIAAAIFFGSLLSVAADVRTEPMARPAQVSRAAIDAGTPNRLVYNAASTGVLADLAAITANRVCISDANGLPTHSTVTSTTLAFLDATSSVQTQLNTKIDTVSDTATVDLTKSSTTISADLIRSAVFPKTIGSNPAGNQSITASTETDVTGLTALNLPVTSSVNTRTYRVSGIIKISNAGGAAGRFDARFYNGSNGTKADTLIDQSFTHVVAGSSSAIPVGPFEFTPGNSGHTKFGVAVLFPQNGSVLGSGSTQSYILVQEVP